MSQLPEVEDGRTRKQKKRDDLKLGQLVLQSQGRNRREARRILYGDTRKEATAHLTRRGVLVDRVRERNIIKRWKRWRAQQVASSVSVSELSW